MIIEQIELENFGPYRGRQVLQLGFGDSPLVVIHGPNMAGKTTVLNAIRWGLYGKAKGRVKGEILKTRQLINDRAFDDGDRFVAVSMTVRLKKGEREQTYVLSRRHQLRAPTLAGAEDSDYEAIQEIKRDGHVLRPTDFDAAVNQSILPEGISRFFLFDGELLNEYEDLVREGGEASSRGVKDAIELILGVPTARYGRNDVRELKRAAGNRLKRAAKEAGQANEARERVESLDEEHQRLARAREKTTRELDLARDGLRDVETKLKLYEESREEIVRLEVAREGLRKAQAEGERAKERLRGFAHDVWRDVIARKLKTEISRLQTELDRRERARDDLRAAEERVARLAQSLDDGVCSECGQDMSIERRAQTRAELNDLHARREDIRGLADIDRIRELHRVIGQLSNVAPAGVVSGLLLAEEHLGELTIDANKLRREIERSEARLKDIDVAPMHEYDEKKRQYEDLAARARTEVTALDDQLSRNRAEHEAQQAIIRQSENKRIKRLSQELDTLTALEEVFTAAVDVLAEELRSDVEAEAAEIFRQLTTDPTYAGLSINDRYGLTIIREDGTPARQRSAGAEQVVALALLGALNSLAVMRGPVIMDTPLGRLDRTHRANILRFVSRWPIRWCSWSMTAKSTLSAISRRSAGRSMLNTGSSTPTQRPVALSVYRWAPMPDLGDISQIYRSPETRAVLSEMDGSGKLAGAIDGFRLAVSVAIAFGCTPDVNPSHRQNRENWIAASGLDTNDGALKTVVSELFPEVKLTPYRAIEDLGEQGAKILRDEMVGDDIDLTDLIQRLEQV
jgi:DNA sulfur modification protein DndD